MTPEPPSFRNGLPAKGTLYHLLFGREPWPFLLVLLACGLGLLALVGSSLLAIPVVVLVCVMAYIWLSRKGSDEKEAASPDDQERTPP
jgi:hypothetical protein